MGTKAPSTGEVANWQERRLGRTLLRTYRTTVSIDDVFPNDSQPRMGPKEDAELQRQIEANQGVFEPLLLEPHPEIDEKYRIIDGDRRWTNSRILVDVQKKSEYRMVPAEITNRTLTEDERLRVWVYIHRQRREWDAREKEMVAYRLVDLMGRASAANILGITVRAVDKLVDIYELSEKFLNLREPGAAITWARELSGISKKLLTPGVLNMVVQKVNDHKITNSKELRKLRKILRDPVAKDHFLSDEGTIETAEAKLAPPPSAGPAGIGGDIQALVTTMKQHSWTALEELRGDETVLRQIEEAETLLKGLRRVISDE